MRDYSKETKDLIQENTVIDSGVIYPTSWHSKIGALKVTNININKMTGFYADRVYTLKNGDKNILVSKDSNDILDIYCDELLKLLNS
jgi:hypothetical protein